MQSISRLPLLAVLLTATLVAVFAAKPFAGGWNDGSRLAAVESLVERGTFQIDDSLFVLPATADRPSPYPVDDDLLREKGTLDKMFIRGHFYSDKSPVPALSMASAYYLWRMGDGASAAECPEDFCLGMTIVSSGLAYVVAVGSVFAMAQIVGLSLSWSLALTAVFGFGTVAVAYVQQVNNHILLLAVALVLQLSLLTREPLSKKSAALVGFLAGLGYAIDLGAGPLLFAGTGLLVLYQARTSGRSLVWVGGVFFVAALPWLVLHHALNYAIAGTIGPANAVPEYFQWQGSPFNANNMTGGWNHSSVIKAVAYALDMLVGKRGFLGHDLVLFLVLPMLPWLLRRSYREKPVVVAGLAWALGTWLLYAATSRNMSGMCCSVRWLVPLLAPGFLALAVVLRDAPRLRVDFAILSSWSMLMGIGMAVKGPWTARMIPFYWPIYAGCLATWAYWCWRRRPVPDPIGGVASWHIAESQRTRESDKLAPLLQDSFSPNE